MEKIKYRLLTIAFALILLLISTGYVLFLYDLCISYHNVTTTFFKVTDLLLILICGNYGWYFFKVGCKMLIASPNTLLKDIF